MSLSDEAHKHFQCFPPDKNPKTNNKQTKPVHPGANPFSTLIIMQRSLLRNKDVGTALCRPLTPFLFDSANKEDPLDLIKSLSPAVLTHSGPRRPWNVRAKACMTPGAAVHTGPLIKPHS